MAWEARARAPMLPLSLFRSRSFSAGNAAIFFTFAALFSSVFFYAQLLQIGLGYGPLGAGLRLIPWTATFITVAPLAGALADRIGERPLMRGRPVPAGDRDGVARADRRSVDGLLRAARAVHRRRRRRLDGDPGRAELGGRLGDGGAGRQERGRQQHDARARRRVRHRRRRRRLRRRGQLRVARDVHRRLRAGDRRRRAAGAGRRGCRARGFPPRNRSPSPRRPDNEAGHGALQGQARSRGGERGARPRRLRGARRHRAAGTPLRDVPAATTA